MVIGARIESTTPGTFSKRVDASSSSVNDTDASAWIAARVAAGNTLDTTKKAAITQFFLNQKAFGVWAKMRFLYLMCSGSAAPDAIDMVALRTATFPAGGLTHSPGKVSAAGVNRYIDTGYSFTDNPVGTSITWGTLCITPVTTSVSNNGIIMHTNDNPTTKSAALRHSLTSGHTFSPLGGTSRSDSLAAADQTGFLIGSQTGSGAGKLFVYQRTQAASRTGSAGSGSVISMANSRNIVCLAQYGNNSNTIGNYNTQGAYGCFLMAEGLTGPECEVLTLGLQTLYGVLTGLSIP